jgi:hypothetical protein
MEDGMLYSAGVDFSFPSPVNMIREQILLSLRPVLAQFFHRRYFAANAYM